MSQKEIDEFFAELASGDFSGYSINRLGQSDKNKVTDTLVRFFNELGESVFDHNPDNSQRSNVPSFLNLKDALIKNEVDLEREKIWDDVRDDVYDEAYDLGYDEGYTRAEDESSDEINQLIDSRNEEISTAKADGYAEGYEKGYSEASSEDQFKAGYKRGYEAGFSDMIKGIEDELH